MSQSERQRRGIDNRAKAEDKKRERDMQTLRYLEGLLDKRYDEVFELKSITLKAPTLENAEWFAVIRVSDEGQHLVGFHGGSDLVEVLVGIINRIDNRTMKWRPDEYA